MTKSTTNILPGAVFEAPYPFTRDSYESFELDGPVRRPTWRPGAHRVIACGPDDCEPGADAMGSILLTVISIHKPGLKYPMRVFFVRQWRSPAGKVFGKTRLRMTTLQAFERLAKGYMHDFRLIEKAEAAE